MKIGTVKEIKRHEYRVGLTPSCVRSYVARGNQAFVEKGAGANAGFEDIEYEAAGATIVDKREKVFDDCDMIVKVKEPLQEEYGLFHEGQILYTYLHLAPDPAQTQDLVTSGATCIAYETVTSPSGGLPLLAPMSEVAGRMSIQAGGHCLEEAHGGQGILLGGVPGVEPAKVVILGGGVVGSNAAEIALGMGADVVVLDRSVESLTAL